MTDEEREAEAAEEAIEDLEAPAAAAGDVKGGACPGRTCIDDSEQVMYCLGETCEDTETECAVHSDVLVMHVQ